MTETEQRLVDLFATYWLEEDGTTLVPMSDLLEELGYPEAAGAIRALGDGSKPYAVAIVSVFLPPEILKAAWEQRIEPRLTRALLEDGADRGEARW
jgi:hypothetical protein